MSTGRMSGDHYFHSDGFHNDDMMTRKQEMKVGVTVGRVVFIGDFYFNNVSDAIYFL